jgi:CheY-like chemotaxis protein
MSILVIEDNLINMELVTAVLEAHGYEVLKANEAESGIRMARENRPKLILMDIQLPGINGLDATRIIKQDSSTKDIPVVALSAHAMTGDKQEAIAAGCSEYVSKPFQIKAFLEVVKKYADL